MISTVVATTCNYWESAWHPGMGVVCLRFFMRKHQKLKLLRQAIWSLIWPSLIKAGTRRLKRLFPRRRFARIKKARSTDEEQHVVYCCLTYLSNSFHLQLAACYCCNSWQHPTRDRIPTAKSKALCWPLTPLHVRCWCYPWQTDLHEITSRAQPYDSMCEDMPRLRHLRMSSCASSQLASHTTSLPSRILPASRRTNKTSSEMLRVWEHYAVYAAYIYMLTIQLLWRQTSIKYLYSSIRLKPP